MIREVIYFQLKLGSETDRFRQLYSTIRESMERAGVEPGLVWTNISGEARYVVVEREFASLAEYEQDDAAFHGDKDLMATWRQMEECLISMRTELLQQSQLSNIKHTAGKD